jgi:hypothetical protein
MGAVRTLDLDRLVMAWPLIDLRNIYPTKEMTRANFRYSRRRLMVEHNPEGRALLLRRPDMRHSGNW